LGIGSSGRLRGETIVAAKPAIERVLILEVQGFCNKQTRTVKGIPFH
jgi:hypothetical protein